MNSQALNILRIDTSATPATSNSKALVDLYLETLAANGHDVTLTSRDLSTALPLIDATWIGANFTPADKRTDEQTKALALSDSLIDEVKAQDVLLISTPIYNFGTPAAFKTWIDLIARAGVTFRYTENGPEGLLKGKKAVIFVTSGGTQAESAIDFATPYIRHVLGFVGIKDVTVVAADQLAIRAAESLEKARAGAVKAAEELVAARRAA
ncbi:FMN-dependent NADH-azoreductase [Gimibacter soli]|uniref:FMN dependent NADH:quinone oxidoreductase n=1 Tax=Gimibacter soli TaxID=3024400 RepID=A0AAE9XRQ9_9PROT|nr:NAD(P)H-dependent oxidoreductase [Gimibacter soli]WCL53725.1 NAD(P)H-dependent oxidoreductase [Gimibacter soli]